MVVESRGWVQRGKDRLTGPFHLDFGWHQEWGMGYAGQQVKAVKGFNQRTQKLKTDSSFEYNMLGNSKFTIPSCHHKMSSCHNDTRFLNNVSRGEIYYIY